MQIRKLQRSLIPRERQAYEGAYDFYRFFIPFSILFATAVHLYLILFGESTKKQVKEIVEIAIICILTIVSYIIAFKYYKQCNAIETTPVFSQHASTMTPQTSENIQLDGNLLDSKKPQKYYCQLCKLACSYRTRHCRKCNICIERYDHHCFWIGNCVGRHNHKVFFFFLLFQTINNISNFLLIYKIKNLEGWKWFAQLSGELLALGFCFFTGYLLIYHSMLISSAITTWEHMRRCKISYLKYLPPGYNPFSRGIYQNWRTFLSQPTRAEGIEQYQDWEEDIVPFSEAKNLKAGFNLIQNEYYSCC